ncbi:MAG TPA: DNA gyrase subunit A, partial [Stellaceae bacterium]|nr:DNA gyrase subunit A [Stellaceae bacterium]
HNIVELCDALAHLVRKPKATLEELVELLPGPDFPTGGILVEGSEAITQAYATGRGGFRLRARWAVERMGHGLYQVVVTEIPYQVQKSRLVEKIAEALEARKLPLLADVRDESTDLVRLVLEPKTRNTDPAMLMESLFRASELEVKIPLNLNVLDALGVPRVMTLKEALQAFLDHRREVLGRVSRARLQEIGRRSDVLRGLMIVYLHLDEVIRLIREYDDAKERMMKRWKLSEVQAEAILNMRLRALRKLEEIAIRTELDTLAKEEAELTALLADERRQWKAIGAEIADIRKHFGPTTPLGKRRTEIGTPPPPVEVPMEALIEREPVTVLCSAKGWIRAAKGHNLALDDVKYKEGDEARFALPVETTDRLLVFATHGRFYTLNVDKLPGGRGAGEPLRLMIDLPNDDEVVTLLPYRPGAKLLLASNDGRGFIVAADEVLAQTRNGRQVMNLGDGAEARICVPVAGDHVAVLGDNRKLLIFPLAEVPEMARGRGVILQRYQSGGLADAKVFTGAEGLSWRQGEGRTRTESDFSGWVGVRAGSGRMAPQGFPRSNRFG